MKKILMLLLFIATYNAAINAQESTSYGMEWEM